MVDPSSPAATEPDEKFFWERLEELGYVKGRNLFVEYRSAEGHLNRLPTLMADVVARKVDIIVTNSTAGATAARNATNTIPIVAIAISDPVGSRLAASLARPGGNVTGVSLGWTEGFAGKWVELLRETIPRLSTAAVIVNYDNPVHHYIGQQLEGAASKRGVKLRILDVRTAEAIDDAFYDARRHTQAMIVFGDPLTFNYRDKVALLAAKHRLPTIYGIKDFVVAGGLMAYSFDQMVMYRSAADQVGRILKGANPGDLPFEQVRQHKLIINLRAARALGLTFPDSILFRADEVLQ
jgi:putative ABC transport system substrate-binding protein